MTLRLRKKENILQAHRMHFYQILANEMKMPHWKVTLLYAGMQIAIGISILFVRRFGVIMVVAVAMIYFLIFVIANIKVRRAATALV